MIGAPTHTWTWMYQTAVVDLPLVAYDTHTRNIRTGELTTTRDNLAFRDEPDLRVSLERVGFDVVDVFGGWERTPPTAGSPELIMTGRKH